jgi:hypothetical protein
MKLFLALLVLFVSFNSFALTFKKDEVMTKTYVWKASEDAVGVIPVFTFPANVLIKSVHAKVDTIVAGASALEFGDADANGFLVNGFAGTVGVYNATGTYKGAYNGEKFYSAADTLDLTITGTASAGEVKFVIDYIAL